MVLHAARTRVVGDVEWSESILLPREMSVAVTQSTASAASLLLSSDGERSDRGPGGREAGGSALVSFGLVRA